MIIGGIDNCDCVTQCRDKSRVVIKNRSVTWFFVFLFSSEIVGMYYCINRFPFKKANRNSDEITVVDERCILLKGGMRKAGK